MYNIEEAKKRLVYLKERREKLYKESNEFNNEISELCDFIDHEEDIKKLEQHKNCIDKYYKSKSRKDYFKILYMYLDHSKLIEIDYEDNDTIQIPYVGRTYENSLAMFDMLENDCEEISKEEFIKHYNDAIEQIKSLI